MVKDNNKWETNERQQFYQPYCKPKMHHLSLYFKYFDFYFQVTQHAFFFQAKRPFVLYKQRYIPVFCAIALNIYSINNRGVTSAGAYGAYAPIEKSERKLEFKGIF